MCENTGVVRQFASFAEQRQFFNGVETDDARLRQHFNLLFGVPGRRVVEEGFTRHFLGQEARQVEAVVERVTLVGNQRDLHRRVERAGGLRGSVSGNTAANDQQTLACRPR